jgi:predicted MFS family arabinose efflux permease
MDRQFSSQLSATNLSRHAPLLLAMAGLVALAVAMGIGRFAFTPLMPMMLHDAKLTLGQAGWLASANYVGYLLGALSATWLRRTPERTIREGLILVGGVTIAMGLADSYAIWLLLRLAAGIASAWILIAVSAWSLSKPAFVERPFLSSVAFSGVGCGIAIAGLACIIFMRQNLGSSAAWIVLGILALVAAALLWKIFSGAEPATPYAQAASPAFHWTADAVRLVCCYGIFGFGYIIPATFLPVMAKSALQGSTAFVWSWPVFGWAAAVSTLLVAALVRRIGNRRLWALGHWVMAVGMLAPVIWQGLLPILIAALCVGGTFMVITLAALQEAKRIAIGQPAKLIAAMTAAFATGQIIGPLTVSGAANGNNHFYAGLSIAASLLALSAGALIVKRKSQAT